MLYQDSMNQQRLIEFMRRLVRTSRQKVFLILDNLKVHHGKLVTAWLEKHRQQIEILSLNFVTMDEVEQTLSVLSCKICWRKLDRGKFNVLSSKICLVLSAII